MAGSGFDRGKTIIRKKLLGISILLTILYGQFPVPASGYLGPVSVSRWPIGYGNSSSQMLLLSVSVSPRKFPPKALLGRPTVTNSTKKSPLSCRPKLVGYKVTGAPKLIRIWYNNVCPFGKKKSTWRSILRRSLETFVYFPRVNSKNHKRAVCSQQKEMPFSFPRTTR